jgi:transcriptional regulator
VSEDLDLIRGTLDLFILKTLTWGPMHGLAILRWIEQVTESRLQVEEGALYPALQKILLKGWATSEWGISETNRKVRFYRLTDAGHQQLASDVSDYHRVHKAIQTILRTA